jgi:hypothetical protein
MVQPSTKIPCESCGMPIEAGPYCEYCVDATGTLQPFDERLARMIQWLRRHEPGISDADALDRTLDYMATMPAWKSHPRVAGRRRTS